MSVVIDPKDRSRIQFFIEKYKELSYCSGSENNLTNQNIADIYSKVTKSFYNAADEKNEKIPYDKMLCIVFVFMQVFEQHGEDFFSDHLTYQLNYYKEFGLKEHFKSIDFD